MYSMDKYVTATGVLTLEGEEYVRRASEILSTASFRNSDAHGWYDGLWQNSEETLKESLLERNFGEVIALITSELSEALESYRNNEPLLWYKHNFDPDFVHGPDVYSTYSKEPEYRGSLGKPEGIAAEFADAIIRIMDYAGAYYIPVGQALVNKHAYNVTRPYRHGNRAC